MAEEFKGQFECLGENTENDITFSVPIKKEHANDKTITYKIKFIDSCRFMRSKLSDLVDNLTIKFAKHAWREKISNQNAILLGLEIIDWITDVKNARKHLPSP